MLTSPYGSLREIAVEQVFEHVCLRDFERKEEAIQILKDTKWSEQDERGTIEQASKQLHKLILL